MGDYLFTPANRCFQKPLHLLQLVTGSRDMARGYVARGKVGC